MADAQAIKIAITAMGGQGGGVLSTWIVKLAEKAGYLAQYTSVPEWPSVRALRSITLKFSPETMLKNIKNNRFLL